MSPIASNVRTALKLQLDYAATVCGPLPSGVPAQFDELHGLTVEYDEHEAAIRADVTKSDVGRRGARAEAQAATETAVTRWQTVRGDGMRAQLGAERSTLEREALARLPKPTLMAAQQWIPSLSSMDPLERTSLYFGANDAEQLVMELAAETVGRLPHRRPDGAVVLEPLLDPEVVARTKAARIARLVGPESTARLAKLEQIARLYDSAARTVLGLLRQQSR